MKTWIRAITMVLAGMIFLPATAWAEADDDQQRVRTLREQGEILPLHVILEKAQTQRPGHVLEVEFKESDHRYTYEVQILSPEGEVWEVEINAVTGEPLEVEPHSRE